MQVRSVLFSLSSMFLIFGTVVAQTIDCSAIIQEMITLTAEQCAILERNEACYGSAARAFNLDQALLPFETSGDSLAVEEIGNLSTLALDSNAATWGVALLNLQADLSDFAIRENVRGVLFGEVDIEQTALAVAAIPTQITSNSRVRSGPGTDFAQVGSVVNGTDVNVVGRTADNVWVQIEFPGTDDSIGWVNRGAIGAEIEIESLPTPEDDNPFGAPMQSFRLRTGGAERRCDTAPLAGLLLQTPFETSANFLINGVGVRISDTVIVRQERDLLELVNVSGIVTITVGNQTRVLRAGETLSVSESAGVGEIGIYNLNDVRGVPLQLLPENVTIAPVITSHFMPPTRVNPDNSPVEVLQFVDFLDGDGDTIVEVRGTFVSADTFRDGRNFIVRNLDVTYAEEGNTNRGTIKLDFECTVVAEATWDLVIIDAAGNESPPYRATYSCIQ